MIEQGFSVRQNGIYF